MFQFFISALVTMLPDYLYRRYAQGKRLGKEITLYNFWYELRWGIIACAVLTLTLLLLGGGKETGSPMANVVNQNVSVDELPFFITAPGQTDGLLIAVALSLVLVVLGLGILYFRIQAWPDRLAKGATKVQLQIVGILGLISLFTFNNIYWVAGLILASVRLPDFITPLKEIASALSKSPTTKN
ncbi:hypothetical protein [Methyloceanibacter sp.]|jgi:uncharacterized protein YjeT (DUF2065 family)|uniref:hypothetical protein n=1 Tax=Methyloceanibacter sp. TaxID=1965321 RepID=UPI003564B898